MESMLVPLILFAFAAAITPGPNNIMIMVSGLNFGYRRSMPHLLGICFGVPVLLLAIGFGLGSLFELYPQLHEVIRIAGVLYLLFLAWLIANAAPIDADHHVGKPLTFLQAALFQWINPKTWVMGSSALAAYTDVSGDIYAQVVLITGVFFAFTFPSAGAWLVLGRSLRRFINNPRHQRWFNICMAVLLVGSLWPVVAEIWQQYAA
ncbi:MAG: LysE family translocator [Gammaproteobacteria bacterium]|nr:LysE family translocator [Gammaproteobacteria bacterium]